MTRPSLCLLLFACAACTATEPAALELDPTSPTTPSRPGYVVAPEEQPTLERPSGCWTDGTRTWTVQAGAVRLSGKRAATYPLTARGPTYAFTHPGHRHRAASRFWQRGHEVIVHHFTQRDGRTWHWSGVQALQRCDASTSHSS